MRRAALDVYGLLVAVWENGTLRIALQGSTAPNARTGRVVRLLRELLPELGQARGMVFVQCDDIVHNPVGSLGFCRRRGEAPAVILIPDTYFLDSRGYADLRALAEGGGLPSWEERTDEVFWRGTATNHGLTAEGAPIQRLEQIPRVALCLRLRDVARTDAAIAAPWGFAFPAEAAVAWFNAERIFRPAVRPVEQARRRYLIDVDGVTNAWGFYEKLLLGACVLKVASPFEQWFYGDITPWTHYVPVAADLSDLEERIDWCRRNEAAAAAIARAGQAYALSFTYDDARALVLSALRRRFASF